MLIKRFSVLFYLKKSKNYKGGPTPIYLRITVNAERVEVSVQRTCDPSRWNAHAGRANGTKEEIRALNSFLEALQMKVYEVHRRLLDSKEAITAERIKNQLLGIKEQLDTILEIFEQHNKQMALLVGKDFSPLTLKRYKTALEHTRSFIQWKYKVSDFEIEKIDYSFISDYEFWFKSVQNCNHNSTMKYLACFKKIVLICVKKGLLQKSPFTGYKLTKKDVDIPFLTKEELAAISLKSIPNERLSQVRDIFLFSCYTGLAYADVEKLKPTEINTGVDGEQWIFTNRQKTAVSSRIPLLPVPLKIIESYRNHPQCIRKGCVLPMLSNQKMNAYLKEIADICKINKNLTFHIARHTFATTVTLSNGAPMESVSKMLGHASIRTTQHYARVLDNKVSEDMQAVKRKLS
jgi:site-specific recombinase XerD